MKNNFVAKNAHKYNKSSIQKDKKKDKKRGYEKHKKLFFSVVILLLLSGCSNMGQYVYRDINSYVGTTVRSTTNSVYNAYDGRLQRTLHNEAYRWANQ